MLPKVEAQNYAEEHYQYDSIYKTIKGYYNRGLYHKAVELPNSLEGNRYVNASTHYFFARVYALSNEFNNTLLNLEKAVKGGITKTQIERMYDLDGFRESNLHIIYEMNYKKWHQEYLDNQNQWILDSNYIKKIRQIRQEYSKKIKMRTIDGDDVFEVKDSEEFFLNKKKLDSITFLEIVSITLEKGLLTKRILGEDYYWYSRILRYNMPNGYNVNCEEWKKVRTMINSEIKKGTIYPFYYAAIEDAIRLDSKQPQLYGTLPILYNKNTDISNDIQYENPEELNIRRRSVGLCSIQLELWSEARELPKSLKEVRFK